MKQAWMGSWMCLLALSIGCGNVSPSSEIVDGPTDAGLDAATCARPPVGLAARWRGEANTNDDTGLFEGTAHGALAYAPGRHGTAFLLDGTTAYVTADEGDTLWPTASFSIEAWVKAPTISMEAVVFCKYGCGGGTCDGNLWQLNIDASGHPLFAFRVNGSPSGVIKLTDTADVAIDGGWHHLVGVRDTTAGRARLYVDGKLGVMLAISGADLGAMGNVDGSPDPVTIGSQQSMGRVTFEAFFGGAVDDAAYYSTALTDTEVAAIYVAPDGECPRD